MGMKSTNHGSNDSDSDDDGLNDGDEINESTDPNDSDSDDDGLNDGMKSTNPRILTILTQTVMD